MQTCHFEKNGWEPRKTSIFLMKCKPTVPSGNGIYSPKCGTVDIGVREIIACHPESRALKSGIQRKSIIANSCVQSSFCGTRVQFLLKRNPGSEPSLINHLVLSYTWIGGGCGIMNHGYKTCKNHQSLSLGSGIMNNETLRKLNKIHVWENHWVKVIKSLRESWMKKPWVQRSPQAGRVL